MYGWLERCRPLVCALTDGSGHGGVSRLASTRRLLDRAGASTGLVFGRFSDAALYQHILDRRADTFIALADAAEGYNPAHDLCRYVTDTAVALAGLSGASFEFDLVAAPDTDARDEDVRLELDAAALSRKLDAAAAYPEMAAEVDSALRQWGRAAFAVEMFRRRGEQDGCAEPAENPPFYERHGERRRAEGAYEHVIRFSEHLRPLRDALRAHAAAARV